MAISIAVGDEAIAAAKAEEEVVEEPKPQASLELKIRKTMDGNIMIMDHIDIDVVIMPSKSKVLVVAKDNTLWENFLDVNLWYIQMRRMKNISKLEVMYFRVLP